MCVLQVDFLDVVKRKHALIVTNVEMMAMVGELWEDKQTISPHVGKEEEDCLNVQSFFLLDKDMN